MVSRHPCRMHQSLNWSIHISTAFLLALNESKVTFKGFFANPLLIISGCTNNVPAPSLFSNSSKVESRNG